MRNPEEQTVDTYKAQIKYMKTILQQTGITLVEIADAKKDLNIYTLRQIFQGDDRYYTSKDFDKRFVDLRSTLIGLLKKRAKDSLEAAGVLEESANPLGLS